ncbi:MAG: large conductance mechanosensitive channel protein MscL [Tissierellia bacterium]|nr:large conductance mechanosensitive channel protein MscL [Tissierellia bacterium]
MPLAGGIIGDIDLSNLFISLDGNRYATITQAKDAGAATLNYGLFLNTIIQFTIISFSLFLIIKQINRFRREKPITTKRCEYCFTDISLEATRCPNCTSILDEVG